MSIDLKTIKHISKLSRISVDEQKAEKLAGDLNSIFEFIEKLNELNTDTVEPLVTSICSAFSSWTLLCVFKFDLIQVLSAFVYSALFYE